MGDYKVINNREEYLSSFLLPGESIAWYEQVPFLKKVLFYTEGRIFLCCLAIFLAFAVTTFSGIVSTYSPFLVYHNQYLILFTIGVAFLVLSTFINVCKTNVYNAVTNTRILSFYVTNQLDGAVYTLITSITHNMVVRFHQSGHFMAFEVNKSGAERGPITRLAFNWVQNIDNLQETLNSLAGTDLTASLPGWDLPETTTTGIENWRTSFQSRMLQAASEDNAVLLWSHRPTFYQIITPRVVTSWWMITLWAILMTTLYSIWGPYVAKFSCIVFWDAIVLIACALTLFITLGAINNYEAYYALTDKGLIVIHSGFRTRTTKIPFSQIFPMKTNYIRKGETGDLFTVALHNFSVLRGIPKLKVLENAVYQGALRFAASANEIKAV